MSLVLCRSPTDAFMLQQINNVHCNSSPVCISLYETVTGSSEGEMPYHWYTDQRFALFIMCLVIILPLSIPKEIGIQKYTRYTALVCAQNDIQFFLHDLTVFSSYQCVGDAGCYISVCGSDCQILPDGEPHCYNNSRAQPRVSIIVFNGCMCVFNTAMVF